MLSIESSRGLIKNRIILYQRPKIVSNLPILTKNKFKYLGYLKIRSVLRASTNYLRKIVFNKRRLRRVVLNPFQVKKINNN
jgi:hypothetical protein